MKCACPKCHASFELDQPEVTQEGTSAACPTCKARFQVYRESFGARALRNSGEISCASCGELLGPQMHCAACGAPFPDYLVASTERRKGRRPSRKLKVKSSRRPKSTSGVIPTLEEALRGDTAPRLKAKPTKAAAKPELRLPGKAGDAASKRSLAIAGVVLLLAALAGGAFYYKRQGEQNYLKNFVLATYCVQSAEDQCLKASLRMMGEWKAKSDAGQGYKPQLAADEERALNRIGTKLNEYKANITQEPAKFGHPNASLAKLEAAYGKLRSQVSAPGNSLQNFTDNTRKLEAEYKSSAREFKTALPEEVTESLERASKRFLGLRPLLK